MIPKTAQFHIFVAHNADVYFERSSNVLQLFASIWLLDGHRFPWTNENNGEVVSQSDQNGDKLEMTF